MEVSLPAQLSNAIIESQAKNQRVIIMTCGVAGSGKSTLAKTIISTHPNFTRLSIDTYIFQHHGLYGRDYPASKLPALQDEASSALEARFRALLRQGEQDVVLDFSFFNRAYRDEWRAMIAEEGAAGAGDGEGARLVIVYFEAEEEVLWRRIEKRWREGARDADAAVELEREVLAGYVAGFEAPGRDEGEVVVVRVE